MKIRYWIFGLAVLPVLAALQPYSLVVVRGNSMSPTFRSGSVVLTDRHVPSIARGDVVVFERDGQEMMKRVALLPGDSYVQIGYAGSWFFPNNSIALEKATKSGLPIRRSVVPPGTVFVIGDNWFQSVDSREFGPIPVDSIERRLSTPAAEFESHVLTGTQLASMVTRVSR